MSCPSEKVTGYVDGVLTPEEQAGVEQHLRECAACREQAAFERALRERLRALPSPAVSSRLESSLRTRLVRWPRIRLVRWLSVAAALFIVVGWEHGSARWIAWELSRDHTHCFSQPTLPAQVWTGDARHIMEWFESRGTALPFVPDHAGELELAGGRYCPLFDRRVAHLYYSGGTRHVSLFVVPGWARVGGTPMRLVRGNNVRLMRLAGMTIGLVGEHEDDVRSFERALTTSFARLDSIEAAVAPPD